VTEALLQEIRTLKSVLESARDPEGRAFAPLADAYRRAGEIQQAVRVLSAGLARHPNFVPGHVVAARLYVEQGLAEEALIAARNALELDVDNVSALRSLLRVLEDKGDTEAEEVRSRLLALEPDFVPEEPAPPPPPRRSRASAPPPQADLEPDSVADTMDTLVVEEPVEEPVAETPMEAIDLDSMAFDIESLSRGIGGAYALDPEEATTPEEVAPTLVSGFGTTGEEPVIDLEALGTVEEVSPSQLTSEVESEMELPTEEPVIDLDSLAPVGEDSGEDIVALADLAPGPELELPEEEPVVDLADLAPLEAEEPVMDLADLAPEAEEPVMELADLAPEPEEPEFERELETVPEEAEPAEITMLDLAEMTAEEEVVIDLDALGPGRSADQSESDEEAPAVEAEEAEPATPESEGEDEEGVGEPVYTRTLAELYVKQGAFDEALKVYRHLAELSPGDERIAKRIEELESGVLPEGGEHAEEVEAVTEVLTAEGDDVEVEPDTTETEASAPSIRDYFDGLLNWKPDKHS
jgi:tetratricopeptide (TPR) repeat protein